VPFASVLLATVFLPGGLQEKRQSVKERVAMQQLMQKCNSINIMQQLMQRNEKFHPANAQEKK
jgi:hypothetical protein